MLELSSVSKWYSRGFLRRERTVAVSDVSLRVRKGASLGLVGESGSGKTTVGRIALALTPPSSGTVFFDGTDLASLRTKDLRKFRPRMQIVFQDPDTALNPRMTVRDCVAEPLRVWDRARPHEMEDRVLVLLEQVGIQPDLIGRYPFELSGGQKQRVALARALALEPEFLVADEPTAALDLSVQAQILGLLQDIRKRTNLSILFISHDLEVVGQMCDTVAVLHAGSVVEQGKVRDILARPSHPYTARLVAAARESEVWFGKERP